MQHSIDKCPLCLQDWTKCYTYSSYNHKVSVSFIEPLYPKSCTCFFFPHHTLNYLSSHPLVLRLWFLWPEEAGIRNKRSRNRCGCLGGCRFFGGTNMGLDFFKLEELTPSSSSAFSSSSTESDMSYGQSLLQPGEWIITKETPKVDGMALQRFNINFLISPTVA